MPRVASFLALAVLLAGCLSPPPTVPHGAPALVCGVAGAALAGCAKDMGRSIYESVAAANPRDPDNAIVAAIDYMDGESAPQRLQRGDPRDYHVDWWVTKDAGAHWEMHALLLPKPTAQHPTAYFFGSGDPTLAWAPDGSVYLGAIAYASVDLPVGGLGISKNALFVARSTDGGATFGDPVLVDEKDTETVFHDRPFLQAGADGRVYAAWWLDDAQGERGTPGTDEAGLRLAVSDDHGTQWSSAWFEHGQAQGQGISIVEDGDVLDVAWVGGDFWGIHLSRSLDHGRTFAPAQMAWPLRSGPWVLPNTQYRAPILPTMVLLPGHRLRLVVPDVSDRGDYDILLVGSDDGGGTWNATRLNQDGTTNQQLLPALAADAQGRMVAIWLDRRDGSGDDAFRPFVALSLDGWRFTEMPLSLHLSPRVNDTNDATWLGDTTGAALSDGHAYLSWPDLPEDNGYAHLDVAALRLAAP